MNPWIIPYPSRSHAHIRLFCFPYAGAGASIFRNWSKHLNEDIEVNAIQLPGRESRFKENRYVCLQPLVEDLLDILVPYLDKPYVFFGHSMGAIVAYYLSISLARQGNSTPDCLFVSGRRAPCYPPDIFAHQLPDSDLIEEMRRFSGTSEAVLANPSLVEIFLPILRDDLMIDETYQESNNTFQLECPIVAFGGLEDPKVTLPQLNAWQNLAARSFAHHLFTGGHFFLKEHEGQLVSIVQEYCMKLLNASM